MLSHKPSSQSMGNQSVTSYDEHATHLDSQSKLMNIPDENLTPQPSSQPFSDAGNSKSYLFIIAIHSFEKNSLEDDTDAAICLSFEKNDTAFVHTVDESGWGEVTLIRTGERGWVPFNYFTDVVKPNSKRPLEALLSSAAEFLSCDDAALHISQVNRIRDGVKILLEQTGCLSRSNELVQRVPIVRKMRKSLLADWYSLMIKADSYKHAYNSEKIEVLKGIVFHVVKKALKFYDVWSEESIPIGDVERKPSPVRRRVTDSKVQYLDSPPMAANRLNEVHDILFTYIGLILGRLEIIEGNPAGCEVLEQMVHQIILLLRDLLFISKSASAIVHAQYISAYDASLDKNLDPLLSLVSELVSNIKEFVTNTINEKDGNIKQLHTTVGKMTRLIAKTVEGCSRYMRVIGNFQLGDDRNYPDFQVMKMTPQSFTKAASLGGKSSEKAKKLVKSQSFKRISTFSPLLKQIGDVDEIDMTLINDREKMEDEIMHDDEGIMIGATLRALVYKLTDELDKPQDFFISTFLLNFRSFTTASDFCDQLIARFDLENKMNYYTETNHGPFSSMESRIKHRRKMVCSIFVTWMESFWSDNDVLSTIINFANEGVSEYLPFESKKLIEVASLLCNANDHSAQLAQMHISAPPSSLRHSVSSRISMISLDERSIEEFELTKLPASTNSITLPGLPGLGTSAILLSKSHLKDLEGIVLQYRSVVSGPAINMGLYKPMEISTLINYWYKLFTSKIQAGSEIHERMNLSEINPLEVGKQLTLIESKIFTTIKLTDMQQLKVDRSVMFTNLLSEYVIESILSSSSKKRAARFTAWLKISLSCLILRNFNSMASIVIALQSHSITRLGIVLKDDQLFQYLSKIVHPNNNYKVYREKIKRAQTGAAVVPYIQLFLQDLTFVKDGNASYRGALYKQIINIDKYFKTTSILGQFQALQIAYEETTPKRTSWFSNSHALTEMVSVPVLQEFILFEFWRVHLLYTAEPDRAWNLSTGIIPRSAPGGTPRSVAATPRSVSATPRSIAATPRSTNTTASRSIPVTPQR